MRWSRRSGIILYLLVQTLLQSSRTFRVRSVESLKSVVLTTGGPFRRILNTECTIINPAECPKAFGPGWENALGHETFGCGGIRNARQCRKADSITAEEQEVWCPNDSSAFEMKIDLVKIFQRNQQANNQYYEPIAHRNHENVEGPEHVATGAEHIHKFIEHAHAHGGAHVSSAVVGALSFVKFIPLLSRSFSNVAMQVQQRVRDAQFIAVLWAGTLNRVLRTFFWKKRSISSQNMQNYILLPDQIFDFMKYHNLPELGADIGDNYISQMSHDDWLCSPLLESNANHLWQTSIPANSKSYLKKEGSDHRAVFPGKPHFGDQSRMIHEALQSLADAIDSNRDSVSECKSLWPLLKRLHATVGSLILSGREFCMPGLRLEEATPRKMWKTDCTAPEERFWNALKKQQVTHIMGSQCLLDAVEDVEADFTCGFSYIMYQNSTIHGAGWAFNRPWMLGSKETKQHWAYFSNAIKSWHRQSVEFTGDMPLDNTAQKSQDSDDARLLELSAEAYKYGLDNAKRSGACSECTASLGLVDCSQDFGSAM